MFEESIPFLAVLVAAIVGSVGVIFTLDFARNQQSKNQKKDEIDALTHQSTVSAMARKSELDAINHGQSMAALQTISAQSTATGGDLVSQDLADNKTVPGGVKPA